MNPGCQLCGEIVTMRFVILHLFDFKSYVERAIHILKPGGILFISRPDIDPPQAKLLSDKWKLINDPCQKIGHLHWFNRRSLEFLAEKYGLQLKRCLNRGEMIYHLPALVQTLLRKLLGSEPEGGRFIKCHTLRILNATFSDGILAQRLSYGDCIYVFMRKPPTING